jgi:cytochrome c oxidase subunit 4
MRDPEMPGADRSARHEGVGHVVPVRILAATGITLLILTVVTVWVAGFDFGTLNVWFALAIAVLKASLVILFFMHLRYDRPFNSIVFVTSLVLAGIFISFALTDTVEYAPTIDAGDAPKVIEKLAELEQ